MPAGPPVIQSVHTCFTHVLNTSMRAVARAAWVCEHANQVLSYLHGMHDAY
jgi:hypothetical protein